MLLKSSKANADAEPLVEGLKSISRFEAQGCFKEKPKTANSRNTTETGEPPVTFPRAPLPRDKPRLLSYLRIKQELAKVSRFFISGYSSAGSAEADINKYT